MGTPVQSYHRTIENDHTRSLAIEATNLGLTYSNGTEAVTDISLEIPTGEVFGFLGANGAGKTTTIKMLTTLLQPTAGQVTVNGYDIRTESTAVRESIGYMAQETSIDPSLTVRENLRFACRAYGVPSAERAAQIDDLLALVDLSAKTDDRARTLSGGQKKRLDATMALVHKPPIIFLDEPTTGLDPQARTRLWEYFRTINRRGTTIFLTTQYLEEADALCSDLAVIFDGEIVASGAPTDLKAQVGGDVLEITLADQSDTAVEHAKAVIEGSEVMDEIETVQPTEDGLSVTSAHARRIGIDLLVGLTEVGITITGFNIRSPTLDDVFLALTDEGVSDPRDENLRSFSYHTKERQ
ncbi:ABC transporter ATP-binding protein [Halocatena marina]|uniref:ATP-binding cassette domain-containing protein n=1 Tax=Halocatena marina TaxID=2934937 RepID=A0ABD5YS17_9EURY|nr:ATP-binding cassette domain-containing protein [Halocatena marina]